MKALHVRYSLLGAITIVLAPGILEGQACHGLPAKSVAFEYGVLSVGNSLGALATLGGLELGGRRRDISTRYSGQEASLRYSLRMGSSRIQFCPSVGAVYQHDTWDITPAITINTLSLRGGGAIGYVQPLLKGLAINPFIGVHYRFTASHLDGEDTPDTEVSVSGDTLSEVGIEYGITAHYGSIYGGVVAHRTNEDKGIHPSMARWIVGFSFAGGRTSSNPAAASARRSGRKP